MHIRCGADYPSTHTNRLSIFYFYKTINYNALHHRYFKVLSIFNQRTHSHSNVYWSRGDSISTIGRAWFHWSIFSETFSISMIRDVERMETRNDWLENDMQTLWWPQSGQRNWVRAERFQQQHHSSFRIGICLLIWWLWRLDVEPVTLGLSLGQPLQHRSQRNSSQIYKKILCTASWNSFLSR